MPECNTTWCHLFAKSVPIVHNQHRWKSATVLLSALPGEEDLQLRHTNGFDIDLAFQDNTWHEKITQFYREFLLENILGHACTLVILYDWKMLRRSITQSRAFVCLKLATCQIHQGCLSDLNLPPSVVGGNVWTAPREAEISVNYYHHWINADTHTWWRTSQALFFVTKYFDWYAFSIEMIHATKNH